MEMWRFSRNHQNFCTFLQNTIDICSQQISKDHEKVMILKSDTDISMQKTRFWALLKRIPVVYLNQKCINISPRSWIHPKSWKSRWFWCFFKSLLKNWPKKFNEIMKNKLFSNLYSNLIPKNMVLDMKLLSNRCKSCMFLYFPLKINYF